MKDDTKFTLIIMFAFGSIFSNYLIMFHWYIGFFTFPSFILSIIMIRKFKWNDKTIPDGSEYKLLNEVRQK